MPPSEIVVWLECPGCQYVWVAAIIIPGRWWAAGCTPEKTAGQCYCPRCEHLPPMGIRDAGAIDRREGLDL